MDRDSPDPLTNRLPRADGAPVCPAAEGADIVAVDICAQLDTVAYDLTTPEDLAETQRLVREQGRRIVTAEVDVVLANAGIGLMDRTADPHRAFRDQLDVNLTGVWNTVQAVALSGSSAAVAAATRGTTATSPPSTASSA